MSYEPFYLRPGEWGEESRKVAVLYAGRRSAVLAQPDPNPDASMGQGTQALQDILRNRITNGAPPAFAEDWTGASAIFELPCSGPVIFAGDRDTFSRLREDYGSDQWTLGFLLLARGGPAEESISCDLPVAVHRDDGHSLVSHRTGKRALTAFKKIHSGDTLSLWMAKTSILRPDQIRLHAAECGLRIAGETLYGNVEPLSRADLPGQRRPGGKGFVLFASPVIHLFGLHAPSISSGTFHTKPSKPIQKWFDSQNDPPDLETVFHP